ncbi:hypothetical protein AB0M34_33185 [Nocardia sp. NPDC050193]
MDRLFKAKSEFGELLPLTGPNPVPNARLLTSLSGRPDLTDQQRQVIDDILKEDNPNSRLSEIWYDDYIFRKA